MGFARENGSCDRSLAAGCGRAESGRGTCIAGSDIEPGEELRCNDHDLERVSWVAEPVEKGSFFIFGSAKSVSPELRGSLPDVHHDIARFDRQLVVGRRVRRVLYRTHASWSTVTIIAPKPSGATRSRKCCGCRRQLRLLQGFDGKGGGPLALRLQHGPRLEIANEFFELRSVHFGRFESTSGSRTVVGGSPSQIDSSKL